MVKFVRAFNNFAEYRAWVASGRPLTPRVQANQLYYQQVKENDLNINLKNKKQ